MGMNRAKVFLFEYFFFVSFAFFYLLEFFLLLSTWFETIFSCFHSIIKKFVGSCFAVCCLFVSLLTHQFHYCFNSVLLVGCNSSYWQRQENEKKQHNKKQNNTTTVCRIKTYEKYKTNFCVWQLNYFIWSYRQSSRLYKCKTREQQQQLKKFTEHTKKILK